MDVNKLLSVVSDILTDRYGVRIKAERQASECNNRNLPQPENVAGGKRADDRRI